MNNPQFRFTGVEAGATPSPFNKEGADQIQSVERRFLDHFALNEQPFGETPDPRFLYLGPKHRQALAALTFGTDLNRGFMTLIAQPGMGKTSLLYQFLEGLRDKARTSFLFQTDGDSRDLMRHLLADFDLDSEGKDLPEMRIILNRFLIREMNAGRPFVLVIDEAQNLDEKVLESIRLLSNFETPWMKLMQIVLSGQPQLAERLAKPEMAQLRQRVSFSIRIDPLTREEVTAYVNHRLWIAGNKSSTLFSTGAQTLLAEYSLGIPRNINNICFSAMSLAWAMKQKNIDRDMMRDVLTDMEFDVPREKAEIATPVAEQPKPVVEQLKPVAEQPKLVVEQPKLVAEQPKPVAEQPKPVAKPVVKPVAARPSAPPYVQPAFLTVKEPPASRKLAKVTFACVLLLALGAAGVHYDFGKDLDTSWHAVTALVKGYAAPSPAPTPASHQTTTPASLDSLSAEPKAAPHTTDTNPGGQEPGNARSDQPGREAN